MAKATGSYLFPIEIKSTLRSLRFLLFKIPVWKSRSETFAVLYDITFPAFATFATFCSKLLVSKSKYRMFAIQIASKDFSSREELQRL